MRVLLAVAVLAVALSGCNKEGTPELPGTAIDPYQPGSEAPPPAHTNRSLPTGNPMPGGNVTDGNVTVDNGNVTDGNTTGTMTTQPVQNDTQPTGPLQPRLTVGNVTSHPPTANVTIDAINPRGIWFEWRIDVNEPVPSRGYEGNSRDRPPLNGWPRNIRMEFPEDNVDYVVTLTMWYPDDDPREEYSGQYVVSIPPSGF